MDEWAPGVMHGRCAGAAALVAVVVLVAGAPACRGAAALDASGRFAIRWWTTDDGLRETPLTGITVGQDGSVVVASRTRITHFDGTVFTPLDREITEPLHARIGEFRGVEFDGQGRLWVLGRRAVAMFEPAAARDGMPAWHVHGTTDRDIERMTFGRDGLPILIGRGSLSAFDGTRFRVRNLEPESTAAWRYGGIDPATGRLWLWAGPSGDGSAHVMPAPEETVVESAGGGLAPRIITIGFGPSGVWALTPDRIAIRRDADWEVLPPLVLPDARDRRGGKILEVADGTVWISSHTGLLAWRAGVVEAAVTGLPGFPLTTQKLVGGANGGVWAACSGGLLHACRTTLVAETLPGCTTAFARADGSLIVGRAGLVTMHTAPPGPQGSHSESIHLATLPPTAVPTTMLETADGDLWIGTLDAFIFRASGSDVRQITQTPGSTKEVRTTHALVEDARGTVWAGTTNGLARYRPDIDAFEPVAPYSEPWPVSVIGLAAEPDGSLVVAAQDRGIERFAADGTVTPLVPAAECPARRRAVLLRDSRGTLWIGGEEGLARLDDRGRLTRLTTLSGLVDASIRHITEDVHGRLWITSRDGHVQGMRLDDLDRLAAGATTMVRGIVLGRLDGLGNGECLTLTRPAFAPPIRPPVPLAVPLTDGIVRFDPASLTRLPAMAPPRVVIDAPHDPSASSLAFPPPMSHPRRHGARERQLTPSAARFRFAPDGCRPDRPAVFQTRLRGVDADWSPPSTGRVREYPFIPPGQHVFEARLVAGEADDTFPTAAVHVDVPLPWFRRPLALTAFAGCVAAVAAAISRRITRHRDRRTIEALRLQQERDRERARIARDIHDSLGAGLTRMAMASDLARNARLGPEDVADRLDAIYRNARSLARSVDEIVWAVNPRNDSVSQFISYVVHDVEEFVRAGDLTLRVDVPEHDDDRPLGSHVRHHLCLAIREILQNVLRHSAAKHVDFSVTTTPDAMVLVLQDDGVGFVTDRDPEDEQDGLQNIRHRIADAGGRAVFGSTLGAGTCITLTVPLAPARPPVSGVASEIRSHAP